MNALLIELRINCLFQIWHTGCRYPIGPLFMALCTSILSQSIDMKEERKTRHILPIDQPVITATAHIMQAPENLFETY